MRKTLTSILAGISLFGATAKAVTNDVYAYQWGCDVQSAIDASQSGDVIDIKRGYYGYALTGGWIVSNKNLTFISTDGISIGQNQPTLLNNTGTSTVTFNNLGFISADYNSQTVVNSDQSNFIIRNSMFVNGIDYVIHNSTGNLIADNNYFSGTEYTTQSGLVINNTQGQIDITRNFFGWNMNPIVINAETLESKLTLQPKQLSQNLTLNIANNTLSVCYDAGITINGNVTAEGYIINNNITDTPDAIRVESNAPNIYFSNNNYFENGQLSLRGTALLNSQTSNIGTNYTFNPLFENTGYSPVVDANSPLYGRGLYVDGLTTYMNPNATYIGSDNSTMAIPEPKTWHLAVGGILALIIGGRYGRNKSR